MKSFKGKHGVPTGNFRGKCTEIEIVKHSEYGKRALFTFEVVEGPETGKEVGRYVSTTPSNRNSCGRLLSGMLGHEIGDGEEVAFSNLLHEEYQLEVAETESGAVRVESATLLDEESKFNQFAE